MRVPLLFGKPEVSIEVLTNDDARHLTALHAEDFFRPWTEDEFETLIEQDPVFGFAAWQVGNRQDKPVGFVLARLVAGEAEILNIAVARAFRGVGLGRDLMEAVLRELHAHRAETLFLEVDETNTAALALYQRLGFREVARRKAYYENQHAERTAALVMRRDFKQPPSIHNDGPA